MPTQRHMSLAPCRRWCQWGHFHGIHRRAHAYTLRKLKMYVRSCAVNGFLKNAAVILSYRELTVTHALWNDGALKLRSACVFIYFYCLLYIASGIGMKLRSSVNIQWLIILSKKKYILHTIADRDPIYLHSHSYLVLFHPKQTMSKSIATASHEQTSSSPCVKFRNILNIKHLFFFGLQLAGCS